jgi:S1-C subfamily serine protease
VQQQLASLSAELSTITAAAGQSVAAVHARSRFSSSGVLWKPGVLVTAEHTVQRDEGITVTLPDGKTVPAALAGSDAGTDIAVLKVDAASPPLSLARDTAPGNVALSIGRSKDSGVNATMGIISAVSGRWRTWRGGWLDQYIRLDLTLYPGSSGGLVVNIAGEAVGIATSALSRIAGLAIPSATVERVVQEILERGHVARGYLGVGLQPVELPGNRKGVIVLSVGEDGPAAKAGLLVGDILLSLDGLAVEDTDGVQRAIESAGIGKSVKAVVVRGGENRTIAVTIGERPRRD